jgi:hypothetical protein
MTELSPAALRLLDAAVEHDGPTPQHRMNLEQKIARAAGVAALTWAAQAAAKASSVSTPSVASTQTASATLGTTTNATTSIATNAATHVAPPPSLSAATSANATATSAAGLTAGSVKGLAVVAAAKTLGGAAPWLVAASVATAIATPFLVQSSQPSRDSSGVNAGPNATTSVTSLATTPVTALPDVARSTTPAMQTRTFDVEPRARKTASPKTSPRDSVASELALLGKARAALRAGDGAKSLALLDEHARHFAGGQLSAERQAVRVLALCSLGRTPEARQVASQFFTQHPHSPLTQRLHSSCAAERISDRPMTESVSPGNE